MDKEVVLAAFDEQVRRHPEPYPPAGRVEYDGVVLRSVSEPGDWAGVRWCNLQEGDADAVIAAQIAWFAGLSRSWEWKHYSYDQPADLPERLMAAGFTPDPVEALLVAEIADLSLEVRPPVGVALRAVVEAQDVDALVAVHDEVFGGDNAAVGRNLLARLERTPGAVEAVVAWAGRTPIAAGRLELHPGTEFASLWGGGTRPVWRGRGVFRALVAYRAALASRLGFRYLQVDSSADSQPILRRLGFVELATTTPFVYGRRP